MTASPIRTASRSGSTVRLGLLASAAATCLALVLTTGHPSFAQDANAVIAKVDGQEIKQSDLTIAEEELGPSLQQMEPALRRENLIAFLIDMKIVAKAADDKKIGDTPQFKQKLAFMRERLLMDNLLGAEGKTAATDAAAKKIYDAEAAKISGQKEVRARHILVQTEDEAKAVVAELKKGADFATLAKEKSKDPGGADGGDLGFFSKEQMVPEFSKVAFELEPGKISDPVKSQFGWHVIKVEEKRDRKLPPFNDVKAQAQGLAVRNAQGEYMTKLRTAAKIERLDKPAGDAAPAAADKAAPAKKK